MDIFLSVLLSAVTVMVAIVVYVYLVSSVYPWLCMHAVWIKRGQGSPRGDRGVRRVRFPDGRGVVYEPHPALRRYVPSYALYTHNDQKYIRLSLHPKVAYIRYDVAVFNYRGRLLEVLEVSERISGEGVSRSVRLPERTAYACVVPRQVDGEYVGREVTVGYSLAGIIVLTVLTVATTMATGYILYGEFSYVMTELLGLETISLLRTMLVSLLTGVACAAWMLFMYYLHTIRKLNR
ncbi:MAG: hypothetical protein IKU90_07295 [Clostridia bacterium]|nr:hypothetical protein [Clostridia bacterium]